MTRLRPKVMAYAFGVAGGAAVLAACGHSAPTRFFTLDPVAPTAPATSAYAGPPLKLLAVNIPPALDREELVTEVGGGEVKVHDFEHWEAPLGQSARQAVIQDLVARLPAGAVVGPATPGGGGVATLTADVVSFRTGASGATLEAGWSLTLPGSPSAPGPWVWRAPLAQFQTSAVVQDGSGAAQAFSALLGQLADRMAADLPAVTAQLQAEQSAAALAAAQARSAQVAHTRVQTTQTRTTVSTRP